MTVYVAQDEAGYQQELEAHGIAGRENLHRADPGAQITSTVTRPSTELKFNPKGTSSWQIYKLNPGTYTATITPLGVVEGLGQGQRQMFYGPLYASTTNLIVTPPEPTIISGKQVDYGEVAVGYSFGEYGYSNSMLLYADGSQVYGDDTDLFGVTINAIEGVGSMSSS